jgi:hypothetical protein
MRSPEKKWLLLWPLPQCEKNSAATAVYRDGSASGGKLRQRQKLTFGSCKTGKIIRYHYAFDPNPDRLAPAFHRRWQYFAACFAA